MIHHVKQKLRLNLNANVVDAIVHFNVKATAVRLCRLLRDKQACWGRGRLLCRRASCQVHFSHLFLPSFTSDTSFHSPRQVSLPLGSPPASNRHVTVPRRSLDWSSAQGCADRFSGVHVVPRPGIIVLTERLSHVCRRITLPCNNSLSPHGVHLVCLDHSISEEMLGLPLIGCDCGSSLMQSWLGCQIKPN